MSSELRHEQKPMSNLNPNHSVEESYWASLLNEGEFARTSAPEDVGTARSLLFNVSLIPESSPAQTSPQDDWQAVRQLMEADEVLELKVIGFNRGGLLVEWQSLRGFVPASQLVVSAAPETHRQALNLNDYVNRALQLRIIEIDADRNRLIFSERAAQVQMGVRAEVLRRIQGGDTLEGKVTNLCDFGAFVDLGGVEGLIHISELSWGRVGHPRDILERGQSVKVYVLDVDPHHARIALSLKRLHPDPWATVHERYHIGETVVGKITNVVDFGAFACIEDGLEGLIHFSELAEGHFLHPRNVVAEGETVHARILSIDGKARRLGLSLRLQ